MSHNGVAADFVARGVTYGVAGVIDDAALGPAENATFCVTDGAASASGVALDAIEGVAGG